MSQLNPNGLNRFVYFFDCPTVSLMINEIKEGRELELWNIIFYSVKQEQRARTMEYYILLN